MGNLVEKSITTIEVAEMMEINHKEILRKLEGAKDRKGYVQILAENHLALSDYFTESTYEDASGKKNKCYLVTKLGCDFLANKFTGEKGILFTAKYVKRFREMEQKIIGATTLPPQFQLMQGLLDQMAEQEQRLQGVENFCNNVKEVMATPIGDWREEMNSHVRKIAQTSGIDYRALWTELYIELEKRAKCDLTKLSANKQNRLTSQGKTKSYIDSECKKIAVISDNVRLKEIFQSIIKEYLIKYVA